MGRVGQMGRMGRAGRMGRVGQVRQVGQVAADPLSAPTPTISVLETRRGGLA